MMPEEAAATAARRPIGPVTAWPKVVSGVVGRQAERWRASWLSRATSWASPLARGVGGGVGVGVHRAGLPGGGRTSPLAVFTRETGSPAPVTGSISPQTVTGFGVRPRYSAKE